MSKQQLQGRYIQDTRDALTASVLSGQHAILLGAPGYGKTALAYDMAKRIGGEGRTVFTRLDAATRPELVQGAMDPQVYLQYGKYVVNQHGTAYQKGLGIWVADEVFRASEVIFDILIDALDRFDLPKSEQPVVWSTSNFVVAGDRVDAMRDRFAMWVWLQADLMDVSGLVETHLSQLGQRLSAPGDLPTWEQVQEVRNMTPGPDAVAAVKTVVNTLVEEAVGQQLTVNPRRIAQWSAILFRTSAYDYGASDWTACSTTALNVMRYAWPTPDKEEAARWAEVTSVIADPIGAVIEGLMIEATEEFRKCAARLDQSNAEKSERVAELGAVLGNAQETLDNLGGNDPRIREYKNLLSEMFQAAIMGKDPGQVASQHQGG